MEIEPTISAGKLPQTYALDHAVTGQAEYVISVAYFVTERLWK
jgi:hypothetical protein